MWCIVVILAVMLAYLVLVARCCYVFKTRNDTVLHPQCNQSADIIVAGKDESQNVSSLLVRTQKQTLPGARLIFVDDHSADDTYAKVRALAPQAIALHSTGHGKKAALRCGISYSSADYILFTDADCRPGDGWASIMVSTASGQNADMVMAPVVIEPANPGSVFQRIQMVESLAMITITGGSCMDGHPVMCNGGNVGYRADFMKGSVADMNSKYASGDDMFMMESASRQGKRIVYAKDPRAVVRTYGIESLGKFWNQRARWVSKTGGYTDRYILFFALVIFLGNMAAGAVPFLLLSGLLPWYWALVLFLTKGAIDTWSALVAARALGEAVSFWDVVLLELVYPYYVLLSVAKSLTGGYKWK